MKISGCIALVTGGASGIGRGICEHLLQHGAKVKVIVFAVSIIRILRDAKMPSGPYQPKHMDISGTLWTARERCSR